MPTVLGFNKILAQLLPTKPSRSTASAPSTPSGGGVMGRRSVIGSGATFCVRPAGQCTFKSHAVLLDKILEDDTYYVGKGANVAFTEPRLDAGWVMADLTKSWKDLKLVSVDDWTKRFDAAHCSRGAATKAEVDRGLEDQKKAKLFQTPLKINSTKTASAVLFASEFSPYKPLIEDKDGDELDTQKLTVVVSHLESGVEELAKQTEKLSMYTKGGFDTIVQATQMVEEKVRDVDCQLGNPLPMPLPINAPTIWGILGLVGEEIKSDGKRFSPKAEVEAALT